MDSIFLNGKKSGVILLMNKKVGILTWHYYENVGSNLQAYALMKTINKYGFETKFINYQQAKLHDSYLKRITKIFLSKFNNLFPGILPQRLKFRSFDFQRQYFPMTKSIINPKELSKTNDIFDIFVCGSDQIWSPIVYDSHYFLDFVHNKYKFSYAPSIGCNYINEELQSDYKKLISKLNGISVREEKGRELLAKLNISAKVVLDPTFLLNKEEWLLISSNRLIDIEYIFCYFLGSNKNYRTKVQDYAKKNKKYLIMFSDFIDDDNYCDQRVYKIGPKEFLSYIYYASEVFTDSFHGVVFSLKFEKKFNAFYRFKEDDKNNQNSRIINILSKINLNNKLISDSQDLDLTNFDYTRINAKLNGLINESLKYLEGELQNGIKGDGGNRK